MAALPPGLKLTPQVQASPPTSKVSSLDITEELAGSKCSNTEKLADPPVIMEVKKSPRRSPRVNAEDEELAALAAVNADGTKRVFQSGLFGFANTEAIKEKVRSQKMRPPPYNVFDCYHETGFIQWIAKHPYFENTTLSIIVINALWISIDTDGNTADTILDAKPVFIVADILFFVYFSLELVVRFLAFNGKCKCFRDGWFVFDSTLVFMYAFDPFMLGCWAFISGGGPVG